MAAWERSHPCKLNPHARNIMSTPGLPEQGNLFLLDLLRRSLSHEEDGCWWQPCKDMVGSESGNW
jgi:hypothetical protein